MIAFSTVSIFFPILNPAEFAILRMSAVKEGSFVIFEAIRLIVELLELHNFFNSTICSGKWEVIQYP